MAIDYSIITSEDTGNPPKGIRARRVKVLLQAQSPSEATPILRRAASELLGDYDRLRIYAYIERDAIAWHGYVARVEYGKGQAPKIFYDNDPIMREAIYRTQHSDKQG